MEAAKGSVIAAATPEAQRLYGSSLGVFRSVGAFDEELKKTCVHLVRKSAFVGVHFRRDSLVLTIKSDKPLASPRIVKSEQTSKSRWHCDVRITRESDLDGELLRWVEAAYALCG
jgi:hypothetical protein